MPTRIIWRVTRACRWRLAIAIAAAAGLWSGFAVSASASSIVYEQDGNVWLMNSDGSGKYQVTTDGTPESPYLSPSQADDGTIVARRGTKLHRMKQNGVLLNPPIDTPATASGPLEPAVSPDGTKIAYFVAANVEYCSPTHCTSRAETRVLYSHSNRFTGPNEIDDAGGFGFPSWIDNTHTVMTAQAVVWRDPVGPEPEYHWWDDGDTTSDPYAIRNLHDAEVAANKVVLLRGDNQEHLTFYHLNGSGTPTLECAYATSSGGFADPTLSPDGRIVAWEGVDGIRAMALPEDFANRTNCPQGSTARLIAPGGKRPDFGPAPVAPEPRPAPTAAPTAAPTPSPTPAPAANAPDGPPAATGVATAARTARVKGVKALIQLSCHAPTGCRAGRLVLRLRKTTLGRGHFRALAYRQSAVVDVKLTGRARRALARSGKLVAQLAGDVSGGRVRLVRGGRRGR